MPRKIIQLAIASCERMGYDEQYREPNVAYAALCEDGSAWGLMPNGDGWRELPSIETSEEKEQRKAASQAAYDRNHSGPLPYEDCECARCQAAWTNQPVAAE